MDKKTVLIQTVAKIKGLNWKDQILKPFYLIFSGTDDQLICLNITLQLIPTIHAKNVLILIQIVADISQQYNNDHRKLIYNIMYTTYEIYL